MAKLNIEGIVNGLNGVIKHVGDMLPMAQALGLPAVVANVATIAIAATGVIQNVLERGAQVKDALSTQDETKLRAMLADLQAINDRLAGTIAEDAETAAGEAPSGDGKPTGDDKG